VLKGAKFSTTKAQRHKEAKEHKAKVKIVLRVLFFLKHWAMKKARNSKLEIRNKFQFTKRRNF